MQKLDVKQMRKRAFGMIMLTLPGNAEMEYKYRQYAKQAKHQILSSHGIVTHEGPDSVPHYSPCKSPRLHLHEYFIQYVS